MSAAHSLSLQPWTPTADATVWVSHARTLEICGWTRQWLNRQVLNGTVRYRETSRKLPNGRPDREYAVDTFPVEARERYFAEQARLAPKPLQPELPLFTSPHLALVQRAPRVHVPKGKNSEAMRKEAVLTPIVAFRDDPNTRQRFAASLRLADGRPVDSLNRVIDYQIARYAAENVTLNRRTIWRWLDAHKAEGIAGLAKHTRSDADKSRFFTRRENYKAACLVAYLHLGDSLSPGLTARACFDMLCVQRELVGLDEAALPHYQTVRAFLRAITPALKVFATRGRKEFAERMLPYLSRAYNEATNYAWVSDHAIMDIFCINNRFAGAPTAKPIRMRLTAIIDFRARYVVGYSWAWEGSSASIASALRMAVTNYGPCQLFYCDNGKDYIKVGKGAVPGYLRPGSVEAQDWAEKEMRSIERTGVLARLGIQVTHCIAHHPQSKHVERFFRTMHLTFCRLWPSYTGGQPSERPDQTDGLMAHHGQVVRRGDISKSHLPLASEVMASFEAWLPTYHNKRHGGRGMNHRSPAEVFHAERGPQRPGPDNADLARLLWDYTTRKVRECQLTVNNTDYVAAPGDVQASRIMLDLTEQTVTVAFDPLDPSCVAVLNSNGGLLTMLEAKRLVRMAPDDPETQRQIGEMQQQRAQLTRGLKERHGSVIRAGKDLGVLHPLQLLAAAAPVDVAGLPAGNITPRKPRPSETITTAPKYSHQSAANILGLKGNK
jgi:putative transposase